MGQYFAEYHEYVGEEGWYVYMKTGGLATPGMKVSGPMTREEAEEEAERLST